ncbi:AAA family ATPase [Bacteroides fragilis]|jgi:replicative DNA helicase|uniref:replicative DNA helicase n=1 Tax=Bacteroides fragilis TaxID=817 RepID=UPI001C736F5A|nr:DnaB-like helicase C-terminal domain-containing protein [Bacteroides fragilis]MCM0251875.1 AAA family ATPase [Bacteroides fragilis]MCM0336025.1 AAA family ATPase [Bacteroides fragilis]
MKRNLGLPYSEETERLVLGTLINTRGALDEVSTMLTEDCFYHDFHRRIYRAIKAIDARGLRYDNMSVWRELRGTVESERDWPEYLRIMENNCFDLPQHAAALYDLYAYRKIYETGQYLLSNVHTTNDPLDIIEEAQKRLNGIYSDQALGVVTMQEAVNEVIDTVNKNLSNSDPVTGTPTGFKALDYRGVLRTSTLTVIAADSSQGKTSLAISICMNAATYGAKIAFYTMEMEPKELASRMLSTASGVPGHSIATSPLSGTELSALDKSVQKVAGLPIYFDDRSSSSIDVILSSIRMMKKRYDIDGVVVDYLQILNVNGGKDGSNEEQRMGNVARRLKNIAKDLKIWVLALSQLSRDKQDVAPSLYRIRGSGQITEAADNVLLIYRPEVYDRNKCYPDPYSNVSTQNTAMIDVAKGRNIGLMKMICGFNPSTTQFFDLSDLPRANTPSNEPPF